MQERDKNGNWKTKTESRSVTDFHFRLDLSAGLESVVKFVANYASLGRQEVVDQMVAAGVVRAAYEDWGVVHGELKVLGDEVKTYRGGICKRTYKVHKKGKGCKKRGKKGRGCCCGRRRGRVALPDDEESITGQDFFDDPASEHMTATGNPASASTQPTDPNAPKTDAELTIREWADRYCALNTSFKEFIVHKPITNLSFPLLTTLLTNAVRATNYRGAITVTFPKTHYKVAIYPNTKFARWRQSPWVRWFFYLTFLWILTWPILWLLTKKFHVVVSEWEWGFIWEEEEPDESAAAQRIPGQRAQPRRVPVPIPSQMRDEGCRVVRDGRCERAWVELWESTIKWAAKRRMILDDNVLLAAEDRRQAIAEEEDRRRRAMQPQTPGMGLRTGVGVIDRTLGVMGQLLGDVTGTAGLNLHGDAPWGDNNGTW